MFRGITIAAMIMVNQSGSWDFRYGQMSDSAWHGCTLTDLILSFFLFIVGVAPSEIEQENQVRIKRVRLLYERLLKRR